jgi:phosphoribosylanthranilate isomerase
VFVKICGITNLEDACHALTVGADAIGFVFSESPRRVEPKRVAAIVRELPGSSLTVGVFRGEPPGRIADVAASTGVRAVQVHSSDPADLQELRGRIPFLIEAVPATADGELARAIESVADLVLVDSAVPGSGRTFDWSLLGEPPLTRRVVLAGGLTPDNVAEAIGRVRPYGVDVASGVEVSAGRKDPGKVRLFVERARAAWGEGAE